MWRDRDGEREREGEVKEKKRPRKMYSNRTEVKTKDLAEHRWTQKGRETHTEMEDMNEKHSIRLWN